MKTKILKLAAVLLLAGVVSCGKDESNIPTCIEDMIQRIQSEDVWNPPAKIWQYRYNGQIVYYIPSRCCDIPSLLMDENCNVICNPDGGLSGEGDGNCTDFFEKCTDEKLIWKDKRTYN